MKQLASLIQTFQEHRILYWVDSGTLLGLIRDEKLISGDMDIDLSLSEDSLSQLFELLKDSRIASHYQIQKVFYQGKLFKVKLHPKDSSQRKVDLNIFRKSKEVAWCPQIAPIVALAKHPKRKGKLQWIMHQIILKTFYALPKKVEITRPLMRKITDVYTWQIPNHFLDSIEIRKVKNLDVPVFKNAEDYLAYRYGNWKVPNKNWRFIEDDQSLLHEPPKSLFSPQASS
jgi:phosphorylcholine metabolism protein LicD